MKTTIPYSCIIIAIGIVTIIVFITFWLDIQEIRHTATTKATTSIASTPSNTGASTSTSNNAAPSFSSSSSSELLNDIYYKITTINNMLLEQLQPEIEEDDEVDSTIRNTISQNNSDANDDDKYDNSTTTTTNLNTIERTTNIDNDKTKQSLLAQKNQNLYKCPDYRYTNGSWIIVQDDSINDSSTSKVQTNNYQWNITDSKCTLDTYTTLEEFCFQLNGRNILLVGDTLLEQYFLSILQLFNVKSFIEQSMYNANNTILIPSRQSSTICTTSAKSSHITYVRNDDLSTSIYIGTASKNTNHTDIIVTPWKHLIESSIQSQNQQQDIILFNTGTIVTTQSGVAFNRVLTSIKTILLNSNYSGHVLFLTTPLQVPVVQPFSSSNCFLTGLKDSSNSITSTNSYSQLELYINEYNRLIKKMMTVPGMTYPEGYDYYDTKKKWKVLDIASIYEKQYQKDCLLSLNNNTPTKTNNQQQQQNVAYQMNSFFYQLFYNAIQNNI